MKKAGIPEFEKALSERERFQMIDVREPAEFDSAYIEGVVSLPLSGLKNDALNVLQKEKPVYVLCQSGNRACRAADQLETLGFKDVRVVEGGLTAWTEAGKTVAQGGSRVWSVDRQVRFAAGTLVLSGILFSMWFHPFWIGLSFFVGAGLVFSGITNTCGMAMILMRMPWNQKKVQRSL